MGLRRHSGRGGSDSRHRDVAGSPDRAGGGGAIWLRYWGMLGQRGERTTLWRAYVLLSGVVGGLFTALSGVWYLAYLTLDWWFGSPTGLAGPHFRGLPSGLALVIVGWMVWKYHHDIMRSDGTETRTEIHRAHDYTVAGVDLIATVGGTAAVVAATVQALAPATVLYPSDRSELVAAVTVLLVGALWWRHWTGIQRIRSAQIHRRTHRPGPRPSWPIPGHGRHAIVRSRWPSHRQALVSREQIGRPRRSRQGRGIPDSLARSPNLGSRPELAGSAERRRSRKLGGSRQPGPGRVLRGRYQCRTPRRRCRTLRAEHPALHADPGLNVEDVP